MFARQFIYINLHTAKVVKKQIFELPFKKTSVKNVLKYFSVILFFAISFTSHSQNRWLLDSKSKAGVPYATIKVLNAPGGTVAAADGSFHLKLLKGDSILVTSVGYDEKIFAAGDFSDTIFLERKFKSLGEITVRKKKFLRSFFAGNGAPTLNAKLDCDFYKGEKTTCVNWGPSGNEEEFAEKIDLPSNELIYQLRKIFVPVKKTGCYAPLLIRIYLPDRSGKFPGELLLVKPMVIDKASVKNDKAAIDLSTDNVYIENSRSFFVSAGWMPDATEQECITSIVFLLAANTENTFSRSLVSNSYLWQPIGLVKNNKKQLHAKLVSFYAAELWEMR
jgi:hypothetical protein